MNCNINSSGLYDVDSYNLTTTNATVLSTLNVAGNIIGSGTALSNLNYGSITNPPDLALYNAWTKETGTSRIYNTDLTNGRVGIGLATANSMLELTGDPNGNTRVKIGSINTNSWAVNQLFCSAFFRFLTAHINDIAYFGYVDSYDDPITRTMVLQITRTDLNMTGNIYASANLNISGTTLLGNASTCLSTLNVVGDVNTSGLSVFTINSNVSDLNSTSNTIFNNLNSLSTNSTLSINNLNSTSNSIFNNLNSLSTYSKLNIDNLNATSTTLLNKTNFSNLIVSGASTINSSLNVSGQSTLNNVNIQGDLNVNGTTTIINTVINNTSMNSLSVSGPSIYYSNVTCNSSLNVLGTTTLSNNTTCISSFNVSGTTTLSNNTTCLSSLNVSGITTLSNNTTCLSSLNVSGTTTLSNNTTCLSSLNVSGITTLSNTTNIIGILNISGTTRLNNFITMNSPLYINTNQSTTISALSVNSTSASVLVNIVQNLVWNDGVNYALNVTGYSMFGGVQINGQASNNIYKRVGDLTIASPSLNSIILKSNNGNWEAMRLNSAGISMNTSLYVSGLTTLNNATTINGILSVKNDVWHQSNDNIYRLYFAATGTTYICSGGAAADNGLVVFSSLASGGYTTNLAIKNNGDTSIRGSLTSSGALYANGDVLNFPNLLNQYKINLWGTNNYGFGIAGGTIMYSSANYHKFYNSNNNVNTFTIDSVGNTFCTGSFTSGNTIAIKGTSESDTATLYLATPFTPSSAYKCALIAQGMSTYSRSKLHICLNNTADNSTLYNAGLSDYCATFDYNGNVGIGNTNPLDDGGYTNYLCVGNSSITGSEGAIDIGKKNATGGSRHYKFGITYDFFWGIGDLGHSNTIGTWQAQVMCYYSAPFNSLLINSTGLVIMPYGYTTGSDERIKTNIQTIENALDKTLLLRGVEYNDIRIEPEKKKIGLIAQEVELIVPEVVHTDEKTTMKSIEYQSLIPLLIEAIKDQQKQINELKTILIKNNLY